jgi:hypothetical protein
MINARETKEEIEESEKNHGSIESEVSFAVRRWSGDLLGLSKIHELYKRQSCPRDYYKDQQAESRRGGKENFRGKKRAGEKVSGVSYGEGKVNL